MYQFTFIVYQRFTEIQKYVHDTNVFTTWTRSTHYRNIVNIRKKHCLRLTFSK